MWPFAKARNYVRSLKLASSTEYFKWANGGWGELPKKPAKCPLFRRRNTETNGAVGTTGSDVRPDALLKLKRWAHLNCIFRRSRQQGFERAILAVTSGSSPSSTPSKTRAAPPSARAASDEPQPRSAITAAPARAPITVATWLGDPFERIAAAGLGAGAPP